MLVRAAYIQYNNISFACLNCLQLWSWILSLNQNDPFINHIQSDLSLSHFFLIIFLFYFEIIFKISGGRRLSSRAQLVCFLTRLKRNTATGINAIKDVSSSVYHLGALSDVTVVLGMRQSIVACLLCHSVDTNIGIKWNDQRLVYTRN